MLPLLPLTKDGARREVVEDMIASLKAAQRKDLLVTAFEFASLVFSDNASQNWLKERIKVLDEILKNTWAYKYFQDMAKEDVREQVKAEVKAEMKEEVKEEVKAEVKAEMKEEVKEEVKAEVKNDLEIETLQRTLVRFVEIRFPKLASVAQSQAQRTFNKQILNDTLDSLMSADHMEDAQRILRDMGTVTD
jgi:hypothetical protein